MKKLIYCLFFCSFATIASTHKLGSEEYVDGCETHQKAVATCLKEEKGVLSCTKSSDKREKPQFASGGGSVQGPPIYYHYQMVTCGGWPKLSDPSRTSADMTRCYSRASVLNYRSSVGVCEQHQRRYSDESFADFKACFGTDVQAQLEQTCPKGCADIPDIGLCFFTEEEFNTFKGCIPRDYDFYTAEERYYGNRCSSLRAALVKGEEKYQPIVRINSDSNAYSNDDSLVGVYESEVKIEISNVRGKKGTYTILR